MKEAVNLSEIDEQSLSVLASTNRRNNNLPAPMSNQADHTKTIQMTTPVKNQNVQMHESPNTANVQNQHDTMGQFTLPQQSETPMFDYEQHKLGGLLDTNQAVTDSIMGPAGTQGNRKASQSTQARGGKGGRGRKSSTNVLP